MGPWIAYSRHCEQSGPNANEQLVFDNLRNLIWKECSCSLDYQLSSPKQNLFGGYASFDQTQLIVDDGISAANKHQETQYSQIRWF
jgi:hypothetical protein